MKSKLTLILLAVAISLSILSPSASAIERGENHRITLTHNRMHFQASHAFPSMAVEVFSLSGERIFLGISEGNGIMWDLRDQRGRKVPNGLYFYRLVSVDYGGSFLSGKLKQFLVLR